MSDLSTTAPAGNDAGGDDIVQPFMIELSGLRGRMLRLGPMLDDILGRHDYPLPVARLLGETVALACLLSSGLKYEGIFTLQISGDGPVSLVVADVTSAGQVRGYARYSGQPVPVDPDSPLSLVGDGRMAFTVDQGEDTDRYQGIVALTGPTLADSFRHYFKQSEQLEVGVALSVGPAAVSPGTGRSDGQSVGQSDDRATGSWRAGAIMIQRLPDQERIVPAVDRDELWSRAMIFMESATQQELLDPGLKTTDLLLRLFHEDGVRVFEPLAYHRGCRCSRERILTTLASFQPEERESLQTDGRIEVVCEFCNTAYEIDADEIADGPPEAGSTH
ncbi:Hsp33 family molecular chaperone HslO [Fodinicurvata sp. EGI_FJ10296]|uniref:Hsp33 family molecular chaperone HslO n=1 Tax=Fodinicurvata sp. EGI_FJ10296 TaxID=3231908 RepID=UPI003451750E